MRVCVCRLVEEVRDVSGVAVANDEVFMNRTLEEFVKLVVLKGRGGGVTDKTIDYDKVSRKMVCRSVLQLVCVATGVR